MSSALSKRVRDIPELCQCSDLYIFPSLQEGLPVALMEAIASRIPVVASNVRGNVDLLKNMDFQIQVEADLGLPIQ